jgi:glycosyltransferase involved in cell wall biosynthesis
LQIADCGLRIDLQQSEIRNPQPVVSKLPILFVDHAGPMGGAELSLLCLMQALDSGRFSCHLAAPPGALAEAARRAGHEVHPVHLQRLRGNPAAWLPLARGVRALARLVRRERIAVVHANTMRSSVYCALAARLTGRPLLWHVHDIFRPGLYTRFLGASCAAAVAVSRAAALPLRGNAKVSVVHNGLSVADFARDRSAEAARLREAWGVPREATLVAQVARLQPWKGQRDFIEAARRLAPEFAGVRFAIVGGDIFADASDYERELRALSAAAGLDGRLIFAGHHDDPPVVFQAIDVLVHASSDEPFGRVLIEAGAAARPVVAYASGAVSELLRHEHSALLVAPGNVAALADALGRLLREPERGRRLGANGRAEAAARFEISSVAEEFAQIYRRVADGR